IIVSIALWGGPFVSRRVQGGVGRRDTGVDRGVEQRLLDVAPFELVCEAGARGQAKPLPASHRRGDGENEQSASAHVEARPRPDRAPRESRDQILKRLTGL